MFPGGKETAVLQQSKWRVYCLSTDVNFSRYSLRDGVLLREETTSQLSALLRLSRIFGFVARKTGTSTDNVCHLFAEHDPEQPASAIVNFVSKVMIGSQKSK